MKYYTSIEQTQRVNELTGCRPLDIHKISETGDSKFSVCTMHPAYDVGELIEIVLANYVIQFQIEKENDTQYGVYATEYGKEEYSCCADELVDALVGMIEKLYKD